MSRPDQPGCELRTFVHHPDPLVAGPERLHGLRQYDPPPVRVNGVVQGAPAGN